MKFQTALQFNSPPLYFLVSPFTLLSITVTKKPRSNLTVFLQKQNKSLLCFRNWTNCPQHFLLGMRIHVKYIAVGCGTEILSAINLP